MYSKVKSIGMLVISVLLLTLFSCDHDGATRSHSLQLPGAQPVIDASYYSSLQEAIDAVPETGGMLRLPPGEFVINEPLIIQSFSPPQILLISGFGRFNRLWVNGVYRDISQQPLAIRGFGRP